MEATVVQEQKSALLDHHAVFNGIAGMSDHSIACTDTGNHLSEAAVVLAHLYRR